MIINKKAGEALPELEAESFHSCVTDPPYELGFMDKEWDRSGVAFDPEFWKEVKRVLRPGAHLVAFGGSRTHHRLMVAIEDAGFEIRDTLMWVYGGGFPKSLDVSKAIDDKLGEDREVVGTQDPRSRFDGSDRSSKAINKRWRNYENRDDTRDMSEKEITVPVSDEAEEWDGWGTNLKPGYEPIVLARKPLSEASVAENVMKWETGALNIDQCRIDTDESLNGGAYAENSSERDDGWRFQRGEAGEYEDPGGRWPANFLLDERASVMLDEQSGELYSASAKYGTEDGENAYFGGGSDGKQEAKHDAEGGASRFFYCPKANGDKDRHLGVEQNDHPTVKPIELVSYLVRLTTPKGGKLLDPFAGSGTTGIAAELEKCEYVLIEMDEDHAGLAEKRIKHVKDNYAKVRENLYGDPSNQITEDQTEVADHSFW
jgi:site-specific DNA-methyltransferase (adenine-specific)